jgi:hypothetical protein
MDNNPKGMVSAEHSDSNGSYYLCVFLSRNWLDENHPHPTVYYNKILVLVGVALALYNVIRQVNEMNKTQ